VILDYIPNGFGHWKSRKENNNANRYTLIEKYIMKALIYSLNCAIFLVQIDHEPIALYHYISIFGKERLFFPNLVVYAKYIYSVDGFKNVYLYWIRS